MKFGILEINNAFRIKHMRVDLSKPGIVGLFGENKDTGKSNESGKSSIWMALCWCLFGRYDPMVARSSDEIINPTVGKDCSVSVPIFFPEGELKIERGRKVKKIGNFVKIELNGEEEVYDQSREDMAASSRRIVELIGVDFDTFVRAYYLPQLGVLPFGLMKDRALKEFFVEKFLEIEWVEEKHKLAKGEAKELESAIQAFVSQIGVLDDRLSTHERLIEEASSSAYNWQIDRDRRVALHKGEIAQFDKKKKEVGKQLKKVTKEADRLSRKIDRAEEPKKDDREKDLRDRQRKVEKIMYQSENRLRDAESRLEGVEETLENKSDLVGTDCTACGSEITEGHLDFMTGELKEQAKQLRRSKEKYKDLVSSAKAKRLDILSQLDKLKENKVEEDTRAKENRREAKEKQEELFEVRAELRTLEQRIATASRNIEDLESQENPYLNTVDQRKKEMKQFTKEKKNKQKEVDGLNTELGVVNFWVVGFSIKGIQSYLLDYFTPVLNQRVAHYMKYLSNGRIKAKFSTVSKLKSGEYREKFSLDIENRDGANTYQSLSGGAKRRVDLACSLAISDVKRSMTGNSLELLVFDESFVGLDTFWIERFLDMVKRNFAKYPTFIVSHQDLSETYFDRKLVVVKENGESKIKES